ncbi:RAD51 interacting motif [Trinorchestia longiramus]|nr:RAD51 interacting motif [Trinorchestia longiramus]
MASLPSKRIRKVVNYSALEQDTDISDGKHVYEQVMLVLGGITDGFAKLCPFSPIEDEFTGFLYSNRSHAQNPKTAVTSLSPKKVAATRGKLQNKKSSRNVIENEIHPGPGNCVEAHTEEDGALESSGGSTTGRSSLQDRVFQRDLTAALELSKRTSRLDSDQAVGEVTCLPRSKSTSKEVSSENNLKDALRDLTSEKISKADPGNCNEEFKKFSPCQRSVSDINEKNVKEKENLSLNASPVLSRKESKKKCNVIDLDDDFSPETTSTSAELSKNAISPLKNGSSASCKRRIDAIQKEVEVLAAGRRKRACQKVSFAPDSSSDSENEWEESEEEDVDDLSEDSDYETSSPKIKKPKTEVKSSLASKSKESRSKTVHCVLSEDVKPLVEGSKPAKDTDLNSIATPVASIREASTSSNSNNKTGKTATLSSSKTEQISTFSSNQKSVKTSSICRSEIKHNATDAGPVISTTSTASKLTASCGLKVNIPVQKTNSPSSLPGLARAAFKSPAVAANSPSLNYRGKMTAPNVGLRLGLSRRASIKSLHPNASLK